MTTTDSILNIDQEHALPVSSKLRLTAKILQENRPAWLLQSGKFFLVGVLNTLIDAAIYLFLTHLTGLAAYVMLAKGISYSGGILNSYIWNKRWTFQSNTSAQKNFVPFVLANIIALLINSSLMKLALDLNFPEITAFIIATGFVFLWNFGISKFAIFKK